MSNISDKDIDKLFQDAADNFSTPFDESQWTKMKSNLSQSVVDADGFTFYRLVGAVIGVMTISISMLLYYNGVSDSSQINNQFKGSIVKDSSKRQKNDEVLNSDQSNETREGKKNTVEEKSSHLAKQQLLNSDQKKNAMINNKSSTRVELNDKQENKSIENLEEQIVVENQSEVLIPEIEQLIDERKFDQKSNEVNNSKGSVGGVENSNNNDRMYLSRIGLDLSYDVLQLQRTLRRVEENKLTRNTFKSIWAVKLSIAPDLSSVGYFSPDKPGYYYGLSGEYIFAKRWSASVGVGISHKNYTSDKINEAYGNYTYPVNSMDGACKVIDVPINIVYYLTQKLNNQFFVTIGASSYFMLSEEYRFKYTSYYGTKTWEQYHEHDNNHWFGIANIGVGYQKRISDHFQAQVEPFLKMPVVGIGEGKIDLVSTGIYFHLKYVFSRKFKNHEK